MRLEAVVADENHVFGLRANRHVPLTALGMDPARFGDQSVPVVLVVAAAATAAAAAATAVISLLALRIEPPNCLLKVVSAHHPARTPTVNRPPNALQKLNIARHPPHLHAHCPPPRALELDIARALELDIVPRRNLCRFYVLRLASPDTTSGQLPFVLAVLSRNLGGGEGRGSGAAESALASRRVCVNGGGRGIGEKPVGSEGSGAEEGRG